MTRWQRSAGAALSGRLVEIRRTLELIPFSLSRKLVEIHIDAQRNAGHPVA